MNLLDAVTRVCDDCKLDPNRTDTTARVKRELNRCCSEIWDGYHWTFRWRDYRIVTDTDYTTGTVTATNGSRTITGAGATFSSSHVNWHIYFPGDSVQNWYKIRAYTSSSQLELDVSYQGTSGSLKTYVLRHFDYVLPTEITDFGSLKVSSYNKPMTVFEASSLDLLEATPISSGSPSAIAIYSSDSAPTVYSTGTLSGTIDTLTVTGSGTSWLSNIYPGDRLTIGSYDYTIRSVDSDTQLSLYNYQQVTSAALTTYTITRQFGRIGRIMWPSVYNYTIEVRALRKYANLVNDNDTNELLYRYPNTVLTKVSSLELKGQSDQRRQQLEAEAQFYIAQAQAQDELLTNKEAVVPIFSYRQSHAGERIVS